ncbi:MAG: hypothetical protein LBJ31_07810 [Treponema sp.]|jgi:hypothetical protein|nr:hypothetical protein [Treponema sp.]
MVCAKPALNRSLKERFPVTRTANSGPAEVFFARERARYPDPKTSRRLSTDPAMGECIPGAPVNDEVREQNENLPGMGGVFNTVNLHTYHAGNNPVKYTDPDGRGDWWTQMIEDEINGDPWTGGVKKFYSDMQLLELLQQQPNFQNIY